MNLIKSISRWTITLTCILGATSVTIAMQQPDAPKEPIRYFAIRNVTGRDINIVELGTWQGKKIKIPRTIKSRDRYISIHPTAADYANGTLTIEFAGQNHTIPLAGDASSPRVVTTAIDIELNEKTHHIELGTLVDGQVIDLATLDK